MNRVSLSPLAGALRELGRPTTSPMGATRERSVKCWRCFTETFNHSAECDECLGRIPVRSWPSPASLADLLEATDPTPVSASGGNE